MTNEIFFYLKKNIYMKKYCYTNLLFFLRQNIQFYRIDFDTYYISTKTRTATALEKFCKEVASP